MPLNTHEYNSAPLTAEVKIHRVKDFCEILAISRSTYYKLRAEGLIEPPIKIGKRARGHTNHYTQTLIAKLGGVA